ncbi:MAG: LPXTG cell wall anchor domain-containing protein [Bacilli bacterium]|nr:LPXTG cell wall anchor domain-containing protein [Bacilli bacterium]
MKNFKKIVLTIMLGVLVLLPSAVYALTEVKTEEELKSAVKTDGEIVLMDNITLSSVVKINGNDVVLNMNNNNITFEGANYFFLVKGKLEITGSGVIESMSASGASTIYVGTSTDISAKNYSTLTVGKDVTINTTQWGVTIWGDPKGYGATVNFNGKINATGDGGAITITGNLKNDGKLENAPIINIGKTAVVKTTTDAVLYAAGIGVWNINGGVFEGKSAIGIKSGKLVINDGTFTATGENKTGELYGNGIISTGSSIQIENNKGYAGNMEIVINGGTFNSNKSLSIYHYPPTDNQENALKSLVINGGNFNAKFELLDNDNVTIEYGKFADEIIGYLKNGYIQSKTDEVYSVSNIIGSGAGLLINGKVNTDYVKPGEEVTISTMGSFELDSVEVVASDNQKITVKDNKFVMPNKLVRVNAKTTQLYDILFEPNENVEMIFTTGGKEIESVKAGAEVKFNYTPKAGYIVKNISLVNLDTNKEIEVKDNTFTMPGASVQMKVTLEKVASIIETSKPIEVAGGVDKTVAEDLSKVKVDNSKTGLAESVDLSKLEDVTENDNIEVTIKTSLTGYDKEKNVLVYDIKPYYSVNGTEKGIISNDALTKAVKIELPVPSNVTDTHVKVTHKSGDKVIDTKSYEIKTRGEDKYIVLETNSFSTFELSFYTPASVENPKTGDNIMAYVITLAGSVLIIGGAVVVLKKRFNH